MALTMLGSEGEILSDLVIVQYVLLRSREGSEAFLIHLTKELASLILDQALRYNSLLSRHFTIHGVETGLSPNEIFARFLPLDLRRGIYAESLGFFKVVRGVNSKKVVPINPEVPDVSNLVVDVDLFDQEIVFLRSLPLADKNILATHRNLDMTRQGIRAVCRLYLYYTREMHKALSLRNREMAQMLADKTNECADELVKKSGYYPDHATALRSRLLTCDDDIGRKLGMEIIPHVGQLDNVPAISNTVLRGSHLLRSCLAEKGLYGHKSTEVSQEVKELEEACNSAGLAFPVLAEDARSIETLLGFLESVVLRAMGEIS